VLVVHSNGALTIPIVAARRPVAQMVFVCGAIPVAGRVVEKSLPLLRRQYLTPFPESCPIDRNAGRG
jgi:hypothetical protein